MRITPSRMTFTALAIFTLVFLAVSPARALAVDSGDSLAAAIDAGNAAGKPLTITLGADITLTEALPPTTGVITIEGGGHTISGGGQFRVFDVDSGGALAVKDLILVDGAGGEQPGGAIRVGRDARLMVERVAFRRNTAKVGGAIGARGRYNSLRVVNGSFQDNSAEQGGAISLGIDEATIERSSFWQNIATISGGAIEAFRGEIDIRNSAFYRNRAGAGGGIHNTRADLTMTHATLLDNSAIDPQGASLRGLRGRVNLYNSLIAGASAATLCFARIGENAGNLIEDGSCNAEYGGDPMLERVEAPIPYFAPRSGSPVINTAYQWFCPPRDQIGVARPQGGGCDIGAIEATSPGTAAVIPLAGECRLYDRIIAANSNRAVGACPAGTSHDIIAITEDITLRLPLPPITGTITIEGGGHAISGDKRFRVFTVNGGDLTVNNLTLTEGWSDDGGGAIHVRNGGWLTVNNSAFIDNRAGLAGGAIDLTGATRGESSDPRINDVTRFSQGSGLTVKNSSFIRNTSGRDGGALTAYGATKISASGFSANAAGGSGGAISGNGDISNSTFSQNRAQVRGGAIAGANLTLTHLTLVDNTSPGLEGSGRALNVGRNVSLRNSVITGAPQAQPLCMGWLAGNIANLIEDGSCSAPMSGEALLGELTGAPAHHAPLDGSPLLDSADPRFCQATDQLGNPRPLGKGCDIGALEVMPASAPLSDCRVKPRHNLNFRAGPWGEIIGTAHYTTTFSAIARTPGWYQVEHAGATGWISADYVNTEGDCA